MWSHGSTKFNNHSHKNQFYGFVFYNLVMTDEYFSSWIGGSQWPSLSFTTTNHHRQGGLLAFSLYFYFSWTHPLALSFELWWCEGLGCLMIQNISELWLNLFIYLFLIKSCSWNLIVGFGGEIWNVYCNSYKHQGGQGECHFFFFKVMILLKFFLSIYKTFNKEIKFIWKISLTIEVHECIVFESWFMPPKIKFNMKRFFDR